MAKIDPEIWAVEATAVEGLTAETAASRVTPLALEPLSHADRARRRWANADPEAARAARSAAAAASRSPAAHARAIIKAWPTLSRADRAEVREMLARVLR
jgi:hypothetical protein